MNEITPSNFSALTDGRRQLEQQTLGQADFLELMVAQLKNQDPAKPMDNNQFLSQMAQFSMVSGIDGLNTSFTDMANSVLGDQGLQAATLLDRQALVNTDSTTFDGKNAITGFVDAPPYAQDIRITVRDGSGSVVDTFSTGLNDKGRAEINWAGRNQQGQTLPAGNYSLTATASIDGNRQAVPVATSNTITSVSIDQTTRQIRLNLSNGNTVALSEVKEYR